VRQYWFTGQPVGVTRRKKNLVASDAMEVFVFPAMEGCGGYSAAIKSDWESDQKEEDEVGTGSVGTVWSSRRGPICPSDERARIN
jgi:hypothetical protein